MFLNIELKKLKQDSIGRLKPHWKKCHVNQIFPPKTHSPHSNGASGRQGRLAGEQLNNKQTRRDAVSDGSDVDTGRTLKCTRRPQKRDDDRVNASSRALCTVNVQSPDFVLVFFTYHFSIYPYSASHHSSDVPEILRFYDFYSTEGTLI